MALSSRFMPHACDGRRDTRYRSGDRKERSRTQDTSLARVCKYDLDIPDCNEAANQ